MNLNKLEYHKRPTYAELVRDTITNPKDKIALPDRYATQLRNTPQMTRYDDESFLDLTQDNKTIMVEKMKQTTVRQQAAASDTKTHKMEKATNTDAADEALPSTSSSSSGGGPPPASGHKFYRGVNGQSAASSQTPDETMLPAHAPSPQPPPQPPPPAAAAAVPSGPTHVFAPDYSPHLERAHAVHTEHIKHIGENFQKQAGLMMAGMRQHMGPTISLITQHINPQVASASASAPPVDSPMDVTMGGGGPNPKPPPGPGGAPITTGNGLGMRRKPLEQTYGKSRVRASSTPKVAKAKIAGPSQPPPGPGPIKPQPPPPIQVAAPQTQPKMETDSRAKNPGQAMTAGDLKRIKTTGKETATPAKVKLTEVQTGVGAGSSWGTAATGGKGLGATKKSKKQTFKEAEAEVIQLPETPKAKQLPGSKPKRTKLVGKGDATAKRATRLKSTANTPEATTTERTTPYKRRLPEGKGTTTTVKPGKGLGSTSKKVKTTTGKGTTVEKAEAATPKKTAVPKRVKLVGKGAALQTKREVSTPFTRKKKTIKQLKKPPAEEIAASSSSSPPPAPPPAPPVRIGKGKGTTAPAAVVKKSKGAGDTTAKTPQFIVLHFLVTEIKRAIKGDLLPEKDIKTAKVIFEKLKLDGPVSNPNGVNKLRGMYGKHVYNKRTPQTYVF